MIYTIERPKNFDLEHIFDCGQCFRFNKHKEKMNTYCGVAFGKYLEVSQDYNNVYFHNTTEEDYKNCWHNFFDMECDYNSIIFSFKDDKTLADAAAFSSGIRILRQAPWETLCSFIISQNNNIPRIKGIIENMSEAYGEEFCIDGEKFYAFPTSKALVDAGEDKIFALKTGFRAKYIYDAAYKIENGDINLDSIYEMNLDTAMQTLMKICGVGPKVASCVLLFGFSKYNAFPIDVWVKKILANYYADGISSHLSGKYAGIAQQYLFYYERCKNNVYL